MRIKNLLFVVAMLLVAMNASAQWNISGGAENTPLNMVVQGSATIGANVNPSSSALEVRSNAGNYNTLFGMKTSDFNSGVAGSLVIFGFNANTGNTTSLLQGYTNGSNSVGNLALNYLGGNVGIGTSTPASKLEVNGNAFFNGTVTGTNIQAQYQDVAEWVPTTEKLTPGTVVTLSREISNQVVTSSHSYDTTVAGVVSEKPGITLGVASADKAKVATTGRVKVRVDASKAAIAIGDLLVTSDKPGMAMKSEPVDIAGIKMHRPGTLIGKALEPLKSGEGEILVLLSLQ